MRQQKLFPRNDLRIDSTNGALVVKTPFNPSFVAALKSAIAATDRKWDPDGKVWVVSPTYGAKVQQLIEQHYGETIDLPEEAHSPQEEEIRLLDVRYIGSAKKREDGTKTAFGWSDGGWHVIFPKSVLFAWFGQTERPDDSVTLYEVLGIRQNCSVDEIKRAWKRLARQWHPDVCREPDAHEQFMAIQNAYEVLSDEVKRGKYDAGLALQAIYEKQEARKEAKVEAIHGYRCPLRCGLILAKGQDKLGRFVVSEIYQWEDVTNAAGEILVSTWQAGEDHFEESWVPA